MIAKKFFDCKFNCKLLNCQTLHLQTSQWSAVPIRMTSLDISSVRDFSKPRLRKMLIDFYRFNANPIGPPDQHKIELGADYDKMIALTNRYLFKELNGKEHYALARQNFDNPTAFIYVKLLNANKFTKKVGDYLIEFRVIRRRSSRSKEIHQNKKSVSSPGGRNVSRSKSKTDLRGSKTNQSKSKTTVKEHIKPARLTMDKVKMLERKMRYGFVGRSHSEQARRLSREIFQQSTTNATVLSRTSEPLFGVPPNWAYCSSYELELNKTLDPTDLFLEIDVRLIEFLDINPQQAKIGKRLWETPRR